MTDKRKILNRATFAGALAASLFCGAAVAQDYYTDARGETVIVRPNRHPLGVIQHEQRLGGGHSGSLYSERVSLSRAVSYSDLDLSRTADYRRLEVRVRNTARRICAQLSDQQSLNAFDRDIDPSCVNNAVRGAMAQVRS
jgi:UrcA family protein